MNHVLSPNLPEELGAGEIHRLLHQTANNRATHRRHASACSLRPSIFDSGFMPALIQPQRHTGKGHNARRRGLCQQHLSRGCAVWVQPRHVQISTTTMIRTPFGGDLGHIGISLSLLGQRSERLVLSRTTAMRLCDQKQRKFTRISIVCCPPRRPNML